MKKVLVAVAVLCVVLAAGAALAQNAGHEGHKQFPPRVSFDQRGPQHGRQMPQPGQFRSCRCGDGHGAHGAGFDGHGAHGAKPEAHAPKGPRGLMFAPDMPEEIRAKVVEAAKLHIDLEAALSAKPIDKSKALEVFTQIQKVEQEIEAWKFAKKLDRIEAFRARKVHPAHGGHKPEAPAPAPEAPADTAE